MTNVAADIRTEAPAGSKDGPQLRVHFILNGVPRSALSDDGADESAGDRIPFTTATISHQIAPEEAGTLRELFGYAVALVVETDDGSGKPHIQPFVISRKESA